MYSSPARPAGAFPGETAVLESWPTAWAAVVSRFPSAAPRIMLERTGSSHHAHAHALASVLVLRQLARWDGRDLVGLDGDEHGQADVGTWSASWTGMASRWWRR